MTFYAIIIGFIPSTNWCVWFCNHPRYEWQGFFCQFTGGSGGYINCINYSQNPILNSNYVNLCQSKSNIYIYIWLGSKHWWYSFTPAQALLVCELEMRGGDWECGVGTWPPGLMLYLQSSAALYWTAQCASVQSLPQWLVSAASSELGCDSELLRICCRIQMSS